jgi:two-component system, cell cycle sensor histidine kinase PleC
VATDPHLMPEALAIAVAAVSGLVIALGFVAMMLDRHLVLRASAEAAVLRAHVAELEATKQALEATSESLKTALAEAAAGSEAKSRFVTTMSHELRTPLNAILGFSDILRLEFYGPHANARYKEYVALIHASGRHLLSLINDVLDITRLDTKDLTLSESVVVPAEVIGELLAMLGDQAKGAGLVLREKIDGPLPAVWADRRRLLQVLVNLVTNAVKFSLPSGTVTVSAWSVQDGLHIAVTDTGIGMAAEDIPKALEPFGQIDNRLARKYDGAGLGLPLAKQFMRLHGGGLFVESALGKGTTVTITLPASRTIAERQIA